MRCCMVKVRVEHVVGALREHHDVILDALQILYKALETANPDPEDLLKLIQFAQKFVDSCHHAVEEYVLFQGVVSKGFPIRGSPIEVMVCEHGIGRYLARSMEEAYRRWTSGDQSAYQELVDYARMYTDHLAQHIDKENNVLFPMLSTYLDVESTRTVEDIEKEHEHEKWVEVVKSLKAKYT